MNSFELIERYLPKAIDKYFYEDAKTAILEQGSKFIDVKFDQTGYVKIASILMDGLSDYYQTQQNSVGYDSPANARPSDPANYAAYAGNVASGSRDGFYIGGTSLSWEIFRLQWVRGKQFRIDYIADEETAGIIIGNAVEEFNRTKVIPEVDACRFGEIASHANASLGNLKNETVDDDEIIYLFNSAFEWLAEHEVPEEEQIIFVNPNVMSKIRNTTELTKFLTQGDYRSPAGIDFTVEKYAGRPIIMVPSNRFFTNVALTQNGFRPSTTAVDGVQSNVINYMVVSTKAVVPIRKLEWNKIYGPEEAGLAGFHGYLINYLLYHGVVVPHNKIVGTFVSVSNNAASAKVNTLAVATVAGSAQYYWKIKEFWTNPAGLRGQLVFMEEDTTADVGTYKKSGFPLGGTLTGTAGTDYKLATLGADITEAAGSKKAFFGLVDASGKIIATSGGTAVAVTQHA